MSIHLLEVHHLTATAVLNIPVYDVGMILFNGQRKSTGADFVSLGLVGGRLEFRSV